MPRAKDKIKKDSLTKKETAHFLTKNKLCF